MGKQIFNLIQKKLAVLIIVFCVMALTAVAVHAQDDSETGTSEDTGGGSEETSDTSASSVDTNAPSTDTVANQQQEIQKSFGTQSEADNAPTEDVSDTSASSVDTSDTSASSVDTSDTSASSVDTSDTSASSVDTNVPSTNINKADDEDKNAPSTDTVGTVSTGSTSSSSEDTNAPITFDTNAKVIKTTNAPSTDTHDAAIRRTLDTNAPVTFHEDSKVTKDTSAQDTNAPSTDTSDTTGSKLGVYNPKNYNPDLGPDAPLTFDTKPKVIPKPPSTSTGTDTSTSTTSSDKTGIIDSIKGTVNRYNGDAGQVIEGNPGKVSKKTQNDIAEVIHNNYQDKKEGISTYPIPAIPIYDNTSFEPIQKNGATGGRINFDYKIPVKKH